jgi:hypothetical protein
MVIDAGEGDEMVRFLSARFRGVRDRFDFEAAIITHPDADHYKGFGDVFRNERFGFRNIYTSGLIERPVAGTFEKLGGTVTDGGIDYLTELATNTAQFKSAFSDAETNGAKVYPKVMHAALNNASKPAFGMLSTEHGTIEKGRSYIPGFAPKDKRGYAIEVLGPLVEHDAQDKPRLRVLGSYGETKNGHSVILRLTFGKFSVLFGGDLNTQAEQLLLAHYGDRPDLLATAKGPSKIPKPGSDTYAAFIEAARKRLRSEVMKVCHHGSSKVTDAFLDAVNPASFVISSGDEEGHVHPRPDLLGRLGRMGRGTSPVLLSTELQRSTRAYEDEGLVAALRSQIEAYRQTPSKENRAAMEASIAALAKRNVDVYGAIYLKTDGERLITAFKIEEQSLLERWFYFEYVIGAGGELKLVS